MDTLLLDESQDPLSSREVASMWGLLPVVVATWGVVASEKSMNIKEALLKVMDVMMQRHVFWKSLLHASNPMVNFCWRWEGRGKTLCRVALVWCGVPVCNLWLNSKVENVPWSLRSMVLSTQEPKDQCSYLLSLELAVAPSIPLGISRRRPALETR